MGYPTLALHLIIVYLFIGSSAFLGPFSPIFMAIG